MALDKPLEQELSTVRIGVLDTSRIYEGIPNEDLAQAVDGNVFFNCYPDISTDRNSSTYATSMDIQVRKRGPMIGTGVTNITNVAVPTANSTNCWANICISSLEDTFVAAIHDATSALMRIVAYRPYTGTTTAIGTFTCGAGDSVYVSELNIANVPAIGVVWTNAAETSSTGYYADTTAGVFNALTAIPAPFAATIAALILRGPLIQMDGYTFALTKTGAIYHSDINTIITWNALTVLQAISYPDQGVCLRRYKNHIVCFGEDSIEFFNNVGNASPKSTLGRTDQAFIKSGTMHANSTIVVDDTLYWFSKSSSNKWGLWKLDGYTPVKVSSNRDDIAMSHQQISGFFPELYFYYDNGRQHLISTMALFPALLRFGNGAAYANIATDPYPVTATQCYVGWLCWDLNTGVSWLFNREQGLDYFPMMAANFSSAGLYRSITSCAVLWSYYAPRSVAGFAGLGNIVFQTTDVVTSNGYWDYYKDHSLDKSTYYPIACGFQTNILDFGTENRKTIHRVSVLKRKFQSTSAVPWTYLYYSKYDGGFEQDALSTSKGITRYKGRAMTMQNNTNPRCYTNNLGSARSWYLAVFEKSDGPFLCKGLEIVISKKTS